MRGTAAEWKNTLQNRDLEYQSRDKRVKKVQLNIRVNVNYHIVLTRVSTSGRPYSVWR